MGATEATLQAVLVGVQALVETTWVLEGIFGLLIVLVFGVGYLGGRLR